MRFEIFDLERNQSLYENKVDFNLSESGVHPLKLTEILTLDEQKELLELELSYGYTNGTAKLRDSIVTMYDSNLSRDNILITSGSAEANFLSVLTNLERDDEIIYMTPNYLQIAHLSRSLGIRIKELPLRQDLGWQWDLDELKAKISSKTKMLVICNPNNPTGSIMSDDVYDEIVNISNENNIWILSDEVYRGSELNGIECRSFAGVTKKTIVNGGLSKAYSLPGLRLGWTIGAVEYIQKAWSLHDYTVISIPIMSDWIASIVLGDDRREKFLKRTRNHLISNFKIIDEWSKNISDLTITRPDAAAITFAKLNKSILSEDFVFSLRDKKSVLLTAGKWHGLEGYIRIGYGGQKTYVESALKRISEYLSNNKK